MYTYRVRYRKTKYAIWHADRTSTCIDPYDVWKRLKNKDIVSIQLLGVPDSLIHYPNAKSVSKDKIIKQKLWRKYLLEDSADERPQQWIQNHDQKYWIISNANTLEPFYESCILINDQGGQFELKNNKIRPKQTA